jgi:Fe2+ or Zn2+ uptake regulation protein
MVNECYSTLGVDKQLIAIYDPNVHTTEELVDLFRASGRKVTPQRQRIFELLQGNGSHPSAEAIYLEARKDMPTISLKTVYQTLHELVEMGEVLTLSLGTGTLRFDPNVESSHHHLVCTSCGKVVDFIADYGDLAVPVEQRHGFSLGPAEVVFRGTCHECQEAREVGSPLAGWPCSDALSGG